MTKLSVFADTDGSAPILTTADYERIRSTLESAGIGFERWSTEREVGSADTPEQLLSAYSAWISDLKRRCGYATADVIALTPNHPERRALRQKFLNEHIHTEDEVRFFVAGRGAFFLHIDNRVMAVICERGDLLRVPANTRHWFDMGPEPNLVAIRLFTNPAGWVARFTGDTLAARFPRLEPGGLRDG